MKLYDAGGPNPRRVRIFLAEKGLEVPTVRVDLPKGESRTPAFREINSLGETPVPELDDGRRLCESVAICRFLEELHPDPPLFGSDAFERAYIEMWSRRMELQLLERLSNVARHTFEFFADKYDQNPDFAASERRAVAERWAWLDGELSDGRAYIAGDAFTVADITGMAALTIVDFFDAPIPDNLAHVKAWDSAMRERHSWGV